MTIIPTHPRVQTPVARNCLDKGKKCADDNCHFLSFFLSLREGKSSLADVWAYV